MNCGLMTEPNEKGQGPGPSKSGPSKGRRYEDLTEEERNALGKKAARKESKNAASSKSIEIIASSKPGPSNSDYSGQACSSSSRTSEQGTFKAMSYEGLLVEGSAQRTER